MAKQVKVVEPQELPIVDGIEDGLSRLTADSVATLRQVALDEHAPAAARTSAARSLAEIAGLIGRKSLKKQENNRSTAEMTLDELNAEISALIALSDVKPRRKSPG